ncbi:Uncharacterised protein [Vibrio cholerae]|nr:Uncharacterised protein [Vibrio cholerae]
MPSSLTSKTISLPGNRLMCTRVALACLQMLFSNSCTIRYRVTRVVSSSFCGLTPILRRTVIPCSAKRISCTS